MCLGSSLKKVPGRPLTKPCRVKGKTGGPIPTALGVINEAPELSILLSFNYVFCIVCVSLDLTRQGWFDGL